MKKLSLALGLTVIPAIVHGVSLPGSDWLFHAVADTAFNNPDRGPLPGTAILLASAVGALALLKRRGKDTQSA
mgnify:CR=1 FL=1